MSVRGDDPAPRPPRVSGRWEELASEAEGLLSRPVLLLTGAGISTESGIPDYRGPSAPRRPGRPILYQEFLRSEAARRRYWARSAVGWPAVRAARPNRGHEAVARLERGGVTNGVLTQNVDGLHQAAGSRKVLELHGSLAWVRCLSCGLLEPRELTQERLLALNPALAEVIAARGAELRPDGDAELRPDGEAELRPDGDDELPAEFGEELLVPPCTRCGGVLKPDVVFFGENVPRERVARAYELLAEAGSLLVAGSSLTVLSGYRFVTAAGRDGKPVVIANDGPTRGDGDAGLVISGRLGTILPALAERLLASSAGG